MIWPEAEAAQLSCRVFRQCLLVHYSSTLTAQVVSVCKMSCAEDRLAKAKAQRDDLIAVALDM